MNMHLVRGDPAFDPVAAAAVGIPDLDAALLRRIEHTALDLAHLAGAEIVQQLGRNVTIRYKAVDPAKVVAQATKEQTASAAHNPTQPINLFRDPVSEVDQNVERMIRARLAVAFPAHDVLGEEISDAPGGDSDFVWAIDPVDGTTNFINGFPLFAASIGVLHRGRPIAGAVWCSASHALYAGVYHACLGGDVCFDGEALRPRLNPGIRRRLAGEPQAVPDVDLPWEVRKTGSAAIECAFVAAGLLRVARFERPNIWDVAGGLALVQAAGGAVLTYAERNWANFTAFEAPAAAQGRAPHLRQWHRPMIIGDPEGVALLGARYGAPVHN
ncbi:inositol monophosphatase family protein [Dongia rigui]|uniref:Inositol monophosphatase n=1 Tax=Dongia rigui TaxID=940149 RepID=A0ABU5DX54_9PROT|nr:inositol monophosphatase [Dongia rigui]MDY0871519.1 inositol monophosphatase [Dongia rigui]